MIACVPSLWLLSCCLMVWLSGTSLLCNLHAIIGLTIPTFTSLGLNLVHFPYAPFFPLCLCITRIFFFFSIDLTEPSTWNVPSPPTAPAAAAITDFHWAQPDLWLYVFSLFKWHFCVSNCVWMRKQRKKERAKSDSVCWYQLATTKMLPLLLHLQFLLLLLPPLLLSCFSKRDAFVCSPFVLLWRHFLSPPPPPRFPLSPGSASHSLTPLLLFVFLYSKARGPKAHNHFKGPLNL